MAKETILIKFSQEGSPELIRALKNLKKAQDSISKSTRLVASSTTVATNATKLNTTAQVKSAGISKVLETRNKRLAATNGLLARSFATLRSQALLVAFGMGLVVKPLINLGKQAAKVESMGRAFDTLAGKGGKATIAMNKLQKATNGTMSQMDLLRQANNAMILGVTKNSSEMAEMFDIAQRLGRALGQDTASSVESLITGIGRQSRLMLDNIGIIVKSEEAYEAYADKLGISVDALTDADKKTAFFEATMESARAKVEKLGNEVFTSEDSFQQFSTAVGEFGRAIGDTLLPHLASLLDFSTKILLKWTNFFDVINDGMAEFDPMAQFRENAPQTEEELVKLIDSLQQEKDALIAVRDASVETADTLKETVEPEIGAIISIANESAEEFGKLGKIVGQEIPDEYGNLVSVLGGTPIEEILVKPIMDASEESSAFSENLGIVNTDIATLAAKIIFLQEQLALLKEGTEDSSNALQEFVEKNVDGAETLLASFTGMTSALNENLNARMKNEIDALKKTTEYKRADSDTQKKLEEKKIKQFAKERERLAFFEKSASFAEASINIAQALTSPAVMINPFLQALVVAMGAVQLSAIASTPIPKYERGGIVGGRRHSQGGTMIEAEQGEFVMNRSAVQSVGLENLNRMNQGGGGGSVTVNVSGNVMSQDYVEGELAEQIKEAIRRGNDFGVS